VSPSQFPTLLKQLNSKDILVLNLTHSALCSYLDHKDLLLPFLLYALALDAHWIVITPNLEHISELYSDFPQFTVLDMTQLLYICSNQDLMHTYRCQHMYTTYQSSKNSPYSFFCSFSRICRKRQTLELLDTPFPPYSYYPISS
jgi:hypothetical protein